MNGERDETEGAAGGERLTERAAHYTRKLQARNAGFLLFVAIVVTISLLINFTSAFFLATEDLPTYRVLQVAGLALGSVLDLALLILTWVLFDATHRIERESDRLQTFMDNVYRRL